ncbi:MAG: hypothetical protein IT439_08935 [Phycisphaerales bacterium]|nr:hypothetical protein [Phycisphaerales bacterium]
MGRDVPARVIRADAWIVGGGIAGLWACARLRAAGYAAGLVEARALGAGQTIASQGIIHGGMKYTLGGAGGADSKAIARMPERWRAALEGRGEVDLSGAPAVSPTTMLWTLPGLAARVIGAAAARALRARPERIEAREAHEALRGAPAGVRVYALPEPVIDVARTLGALSAGIAPGTLRATGPGGVRVEPGSTGAALGVPALGLRLEAPCVILAAGEGNEALLSEAGLGAAAPMQRRPLRMVMARGDVPELHGHCVGASSTPLCTITTGRAAEGGAVWWIGGEIAERGATMSEPDLIAHAQREVARCLPWIDLARTRWSTWMVNRAEATSPGGKRPAGPVVREVAPGLVACWPTKLAYAPEVGDMVLEFAARRAGKPEGRDAALDDAAAALGGPHPPVATYPWDSEGLTWT